jgi:hypothetical protein
MDRQAQKNTDGPILWFGLLAGETQQAKGLITFEELIAALRLCLVIHADNLETEVLESCG